MRYTRRSRRAIHSQEFWPSKGFAATGGPPSFASEVERTVKWRWNVPPSLQLSWHAHSEDSYLDRYHSVVLWPSKVNERDPTLIYFDSLKGRVWEAPVPVTEALQKAASMLALIPPKRTWLLYEPQIRTSVTADGSRVIVAVPRADWLVTLLFVFDNSGAPLRCLAFGHGDAPSLGRPVGRDLFGVGVNLRGVSGTLPPWANPRGERYLIDRDGNVLGALVDSGGRMVDTGFSCSPDGRYAWSYRWDSEGKYTHFIYQLPGSSKVIVDP